MAFFGYFLSPRKESNPPEAEKKGAERKYPAVGKKGKITALRHRRRAASFGETTIPNFICTHSPSIFLDFQGLPKSDVFGLRHFRMNLYAGKPCLIQIAAQPDPRIQM